MGLELQQVYVLFASVVFIVTNSADVLLTKFLNYNFKVVLPYFMVLCVNAYWPIMLGMYMYQVVKRGQGCPLDKKTTAKLVALGVVSFLLSAFRSYGANTLPGSMYVIVCSSDVAFTTILSKLVLKKYMTRYHYLSVVLALMGLVVVTLGPQEDKNTECSEDGCLADWTPGILAAAFGSFLSSANAVFSELVLVGRSKSFRNVTEIGFFYSLLPWMMAPIPMLAIPSNGELEMDRLLSGRLSDTKDIIGEGLLTGMALVLLSMAIAKMVFRLVKFYIISVKSAFYFSILNVFQRALSTIMVVIVFGESATIPKFAALVLTMSAMGAYIYGSLLKKRLGIKDVMRANRKVSGQEADTSKPAGYYVMLDEDGVDELDIINKDRADGATWTGTDPNSPANDSGDLDIILNTYAPPSAGGIN